MESQQFGGPWTERKLNALEGYLKAYLTIFSRDPPRREIHSPLCGCFCGQRTPVDVIGQSNRGLVFAAARFTRCRRMLRARRIEFRQLPHAVHRIPGN